MITLEQKRRIEEIDKLIEELNREKNEINPYSTLKLLSNKGFGEEWSEPHILERVPAFEKHGAKGYDFYCKGLNKVEVKSCRLPATTVNQMHPGECDYFLFVLYDCEEAEDYIYLVPSSDLGLFSPTSQHDRGQSGCFSMQLGTKKRRALLENYRINSYDELNALALGEEDNE